MLYHVTTLTFYMLIITEKNVETTKKMHFSFSCHYDQHDAMVTTKLKMLVNLTECNKKEIFFSTLIFMMYQYIDT